MTTTTIWAAVVALAIICTSLVLLVAIIKAPEINNKTNTTTKPNTNTDAPKYGIRDQENN